MDGHGKDLFGLFLFDHVLVQDGLDVHRFGDPFAALGLIFFVFLGDNLVAQADALVTDIDRRPGNQFLHFLLGLAAERTDQIAALALVAASFVHLVPLSK